MIELKKIYLFLLASLLLIAGWPPLPTSFLLFLGFVPLLVIHKQLEGSKRKHLKFWGWTYLVMLLFNVGCTWWVWNASPEGCLFMLFANAFIMSIPFLAFSVTNSIIPKMGYLSLAIYYPAMEYLHFNWSASWPWMTLGKGLAAYPWFIQWYEYTGEMGGTVLIMLMNIWIFRIVIERAYARLWQPAVAALLVTVCSFLMASGARNIQRFSNRVSDKVDSVECVVSQPNIDPYEEKFGDGVNAISAEKQLDLAIEVSIPLITPRTELLVMPETAIVGWNNERGMNQSTLLRPAMTMTDSLGFAILAGAETYKTFDSKAEASRVARYDSFYQDWYDVYNTALLIKKNKVSDVYHKSKLVPGVEKMPFEFLEELSIDLGGASGSLATSKEPVNFVVNDQLTIAPLVCYESVFGDYTNEFVLKGANALAVITNDGWWGNSPGYKQHLLFGAIRCIETRKEMVRSANTGISAKIDVCGNITHKTAYNERIAFRCSLKPNDYLTFYVKYGNLVGKSACWLSVFLLVIALVFLGVGFKNRVNKDPDSPK